MSMPAGKLGAFEVSGVGLVRMNVNQGGTPLNAANHEGALRGESRVVSL
jgi:hypothetical protein